MFLLKIIEMKRLGLIEYSKGYKMHCLDKANSDSWHQKFEDEWLTSF